MRWWRHGVSVAVLASVAMPAAAGAQVEQRVSGAVAQVDAGPFDVRSLVANPGSATGSVLVTWHAPDSPNYTKFQVQQSRNGAPMTTVANTLRLQYTATGLTTGETVSYRVLVFRGPQDEPTVSDPVFVTVGAPSTPRSLRATALDNGAHLTWQAPAIVPSPITKYQVLRSTDPMQGFVVVANTGRNAYTATGLPNASPQYFRVIAVNANGIGVAATTSVVPGTIAGPTSVRSSLTAPAGSIVLTWPASANPSGLPLLGYVVQIEYGDGVWRTAVNTGRLTATLTGSTVPTERAVRIRVLARTASGLGSPSPVIEDRMGLDPPRDLAATRTGPGEVTLSWSAPRNPRGFPISGYKVEGACEVDAEPCGGRNADVNGTSLVLTDLQPGYWSFYVRANSSPSTPSESAIVRLNVI